MHELDELREASVLIRQPALEEIVTTAHRRRRRAVVAAAAGAVVFVLAAGGPALLSRPDDSSAPPSDAPSSRERRPSPTADRLVATAISRDDLDVRIAVWESPCPRCGEPGGTRTPRSVLAITEDGFASSAYVPNPIPAERVVRQVGETYGPHVESVADDRFVLVDTGGPREWLVGTDGTVQRVSRVATSMAPADSRLWFRCHPAERPTSWEPDTWLDPVQAYPWCALDVDSATAYEWPARWRGSVPLPVSGEEPWGVDTLNQPTFGWWEVGGQRAQRFLEESPTDARGVVWNPPGGGPLFFVHRELDEHLELVAPSSGREVDVVTRPAPADPDPEQFDLMVGTPSGALLAVRTFPQTMVWRAASVGEGHFEPVHESTRTDALAPPQAAWLNEPTVDGQRIQLSTPRGVAVSDDDGRTWTEITTWR